MTDRAFRITFRSLLPATLALVVLFSGCDNTPPVPPLQATPTVTVSGLPVDTPIIEVTRVPTPSTSTLTETVISDLLVTLEALAWSPDSRVLATGAGSAARKEGDDYNVRLWRPDGSLITTLKGHTLAVHSLAWSPDGKTLAAASYDNPDVGLYAPDGRSKVRLTGHKDRVAKVAWSPDGKMLASASDDRTVRLWHINAGQ